MHLNVVLIMDMDLKIQNKNVARKAGNQENGLPALRNSGG